MTTNITLFELAAEYRGAAEQLADLDLPEDVVRDTLEGMSGALEVKAQNVAMFARNLEAIAASIKEAEQAMAARRKAIENRASNLRDYLKSGMQMAGISKIECPYFKISIKDNPESVEVLDADKIPQGLKRHIPESWEVDKTAVKAALKGGEAIEGARLSRGQRLEIR